MPKQVVACGELIHVEESGGIGSHYFLGLLVHYAKGPEATLSAHQKLKKIRLAVAPAQLRGGTLYGNVTCYHIALGGTVGMKKEGRSKGEQQGFHDRWFLIFIKGKPFSCLSKTA
jgi:hypothetical protein